ncbi:P-loop NTPase family protein [Cyclobacterium roseum]|uniref:hypothetical protein n=1 Tax=Cyclobacterium roseum TaxID=2666137 RepID=UPI001390A4C2|nr:hypothetical protein [Cyclobacterium roseum]
MSEEIKDLRSSQLLEGIKKLKKEFQHDLAEKVLELSTNFKSIEYFNQLERIERTTDQYRKRTNNLFYIGFLGHFSSGKSSTINSILKLHGTIDEKLSDHNPTDDQITLITSINNNNDVIKLTRSGKVPVVISQIEGNGALKDKVIMDTPGSGDPSTYEEIVRDSLPLCDLIIYCMAATHPFTNSDIPLLQEKEKHLSNIPTVFLITRGNEFKADDLKELDKSNFNKPKYEKFAAQLAARINQVIETISLDYEDFILIDNKEQFNINLLETEIDKYCNPKNYDNILRLHDHKIDFFTKTSKEIKMYFMQLIKTKLDTIEKYFKQAKVKLEEYEQKTIIGTDKMVNSWRTIDDKIKQVFDGSINQNNIVHKSISTPFEFVDLSPIKDFRKTQLDLRSSTNKQKVNEYQLQIKSELIDLKETIQTSIYKLIDNNESISAEAIHKLIDSQMEKFIFNNNIENDIVEVYSKNIQNTFEYLDFFPYSELKRQIDSLKSRTKNHNPIDSTSKLIIEGKQALSEIFETYKNAVKIYTVAAFSVEAKSYIKNLGLSDQLDLIDIEEPNIESYLKDAEYEIFLEYNDASKDFEQVCSQVFEKLNMITYDNPIIDISIDSVHIKNDEKKILDSYSLKFEALSQEIKHKVKNYYSEKIQSINSNLAILEIEKENVLKELKRQRMFYYLKKFVPFGLILIITVLLFYFLPKYNLTNNLTVGLQWLLGLLINVSSFLISAFISIKRDKHDLKQEEAKNKLNSSKKDIVIKQLKNDFEEFKVKLSSDHKDEIFQYLQSQSNEILTMILSEKFNVNNYSLHKTLVNKEKEFKQYLLQYSEALNKYKSICSKVLNNITFNKNILLKQSKLLKENSINPSFTLLEQTRNNIAEVKMKIEEIEVA